ncbi:unnamed protein product [Phytophthora lilii]|uniref:Unnamed protein product n=1 Tax=Phytophthora lilii TaxID=2077276 RepID=A0A9W6TTC7_9STRA|nr:unnamed protein product [Phytophthora lilii]
MTVDETEQGQETQQTQTKRPQETEDKPKKKQKGEKKETREDTEDLEGQSEDLKSAHAAMKSINQVKTINGSVQFEMRNEWPKALYRIEGSLKRQEGLGPQAADQPAVEVAARALESAAAVFKKLHWTEDNVQELLNMLAVLTQVCSKNNMLRRHLHRKLQPIRLAKVRTHVGFEYDFGSLLTLNYAYVLSFRRFSKALLDLLDERKRKLTQPAKPAQSGTISSKNTSEADDRLAEVLAQVEQWQDGIFSMDQLDKVIKVLSEIVSCKSKGWKPRADPTFNACLDKLKSCIKMIKKQALRNKRLHSIKRRSFSQNDSRALFLAVPMYRACILRGLSTGTATALQLHLVNVCIRGLSAETATALQLHLVSGKMKRGGGGYKLVQKSLGELDGVVVRQETQVGEIVAQAVVIPWEASNKYSIHRLPTGKKVKNHPSDHAGWSSTGPELKAVEPFMRAHEKSWFCSRIVLQYLGCGCLRPLKMHFSVAGDNGDVYVIDRPYKCGGALCCQLEMNLSGVSEDSVEVKRIGRIREDFSPYMGRCCSACCLATSYTDIERALPDGTYEKRYSLRV